MPAMPINVRTAMLIFMVSRMAHSGVVTSARFTGGWLIWTAMNSRPPATAQRPAARVRDVVVSDMSDSLVRWSAAAPRRLVRTYGRVRSATSPFDVMYGVRLGRTRGDEATFAAMGDSRPAGCDAELGEDVLGVGTQRVVRHEELPSDLRGGQLAVEQPQHLELPPGQCACRQGGPGLDLGPGAIALGEREQRLDV